MNESDSEQLAAFLQRDGYTLAKKQADADLIIFNTCCIRDTAENRAMGNIGKLKQLKKDFPNKRIAVGGCMPKQEGVAEKIKKTFPFVEIIDTQNPELVAKTGNISIIHGCNNFCSYCIVPYVRGRERSVSSNIILNEAKGLKEITLLGQNVNSYKCPETGINFAQLLAKIPSETKISFLTSHPKDFTEDVIKTIANHKNISRVIHLPVQSGSNNILQAMNRKYTREQYLNTIALIRKHIPEAELTTDIIVGFPGETEEDYAQTVDLVKQVRFVAAFIFMYNKRTGTPASTMANQIPLKIKQQRINNLIEIQRNISNGK